MAAILPPSRSRTTSPQAANEPSDCRRYCAKAGAPDASVRTSRDPRHPAPRPSSHPLIDSGPAARTHTAASTSSRLRAAARRAHRRRRLEGVDVTIEQFRFVPLNVLFGRLQADVALRERRAGPLNRAVHRRGRHLERLRRLRSGPAEHFHQQQHRALARWQMLHRRHEREANALAQYRQFVRVGVGGQRPRIGHGLQPVRARQGLERIVDRFERTVFNRPRAFDRDDSASRQTLVAMRYSHVRSDERSSNRSACCQARTIVSCTASSASKAEPSMR